MDLALWPAYLTGMSSSVVAHVMHALEAFGPAAIFLGAGFEGQTAVVAGGVLARRGVMSLAEVLLYAAAGSAAVDQGLYWVGRYGRSTRFVKRAMEKPAFEKAMHFVERHPIAFIMAFRYVYGLRAVSPVAMGISAMSSQLFAALNVVAALVWAAIFVGIGYFFGETVEALFGRFGAMESILMVVTVAILLAGGAWLAIRSRTRPGP